MNLVYFFFLNKTTNGGSENNLVYSNARELIIKNRRKGIAQAKRDYETKNKYNQRKCSKWPPFIRKHNRANRKRLSLEFVTISGVIVAKAS
jgi:hypothetical protein